MSVPESVRGGDAETPEAPEARAVREFIVHLDEEIITPQSRARHAFDQGRYGDSRKLTMEVGRIAQREIGAAITDLTARFPDLDIDELLSYRGKTLLGIQVDVASTLLSDVELLHQRIHSLDGEQAEESASESAASLIRERDTFLSDAITLYEAAVREGETIEKREVPLHMLTPLKRAYVGLAQALAFSHNGNRDEIRALQCIRRLEQLCRKPSPGTGGTTIVPDTKGLMEAAMAEADIREQSVAVLQGRDPKNYERQIQEGKVLAAAKWLEAMTAEVAPDTVHERFYPASSLFRIIDMIRARRAICCEHLADLGESVHFTTLDLMRLAAALIGGSPTNDPNALRIFEKLHRLEVNTLRSQVRARAAANGSGGGEDPYEGLVGS